MNLSKRSKVVIGAVALVAVGSLIGGGIAWAAVAPPPVPLTPEDTMYACVSPSGKVKAGTLKLNVAPTTCPSATDWVRSWTAQGPEGPQGPAGTTTNCVGYPHVGIDWHACELLAANLSFAMLANANLSAANLQSANLNGAILDSANLTGASLRYSTVTNANVYGVNLNGAYLDGANLSNSGAQMSNLSYAILTDANLTYTALFGSDLTGADLSGANLTGANVTDIIWSNTTCPDGSNSDSHGNTCIGYGI
jgi:hypothetical protein